MVSGRVKQFAIGAGSSMLGLANYLCYRQWDAASDIYYLFRKFDSLLPSVDLEGLCHSVPNYFGETIGYTPQFLHTFGVSLMGMSLAEKDNPKTQLKYCAAWSLFNLAGEIGQGLELLPGTYDTKDVLAILGGGALAFATGRLTTPRNKNKLLPSTP